MSDEIPSPELDDEQKIERRKARKSEKAERQALLSAYSKMASTPDGKTVLLDILEQAGIYRDGLNELELGRRSLGLFIITRLMEADPKLYPKILRDFIDEAQS